MKYLYRLQLSFVLLLLTVTTYAQIFNIKDYGALSDGKSISTAAIQKAVDACYKNGGGRVYVPAGTFITGTINLKSNTSVTII